MSFVYTANAIQATVATILNSYTDTFWYWLDGDPRKQGSYPGGNVSEGAYYRQKQKLFHEWLSGGQGISTVFSKDWGYWRWPTDPDALKELENDWVPPSQQIIYGLPPLPQEPQVRQRIHLPDGTRRTVRLKTFKGVHI